MTFTKLSFLLLLGNAGGFQAPFPRQARPDQRLQAVVANEATETPPSPPLLEDLPLPPKKRGLFRRVRDTFSYFKNPDRFLANRSEELGPVFQCYQFFQPVVVAGGQAAVKEFIDGKELNEGVIYPQLPPSFLDLHTKWGTLNQDINDVMFKQARGLYRDVLQSKDALRYHTKTLEPEIEKYVQELVKRVKKNPDEPVYLVPELIELCLNIFAKTFSGKDLTKEQMQMFIDYNAGLLSLSKKSKTYKTAMESLETLRDEMLQRFHALDGPEISKDAPGKFYHDFVYGREGWEDEERIATGIVLFIWGAYVESAATMIDSLVLMNKHDVGARDRILDEFRDRKESSLTERDFEFWDEMSYTLGVIRETLRLVPPGGGVPRHSNQDYSLVGYRIPAGLSVMLDPRIGNRDPGLFVEPDQYEPFRWVPTSNSAEDTSKCPFQGTARNLGPGSWFPGGNGAHKCPGVSLAELVAKMFLAKMAKNFAAWEFSGDGLTKDGEIKYNNIPIKICPDDLGLYLRPAE